MLGFSGIVLAENFPSWYSRRGYDLSLGISKLSFFCSGIREDTLVKIWLAFREWDKVYHFNDGTIFTLSISVNENFLGLISAVLQGSFSSLFEKIDYNVTMLVRSFFLGKY